MSHAALTLKIDIFDSRPVVSDVEGPYTTCSFQAMCVSKHKMAYWKETVMHVWSHNSSISDYMQL